MQDRYTCDIGDFVKYGLLRSICGRRRLGVAWYLHPNAGRDGDGRHVAYLDDERWRLLDPDLFDVLKRLVNRRERVVAAVQREGVLANAKFAADPLDIATVPVRDRCDWRRRWFERVVDELSGCDLVFADPDNGLCHDDGFQPTRKESAKRLPLAEANALAAGRTAVFYHHNTRHPGGHRCEIQSLMDQLPGCRYAYYWRRWSNRTFFIVNADEETERRLNSFAQHWGANGELWWQDPAARGAPPRIMAAGDTAVPAADNRPATVAAELESDPVIEAYKRDVDRTLLRQNLRRSVAERVANLIALQNLADEARRAGKSGGRRR